MSKLLIGILLMETFSNQAIEFNCAIDASQVSEEVKLTKGKKIHICLHFLPYGVKIAFEVTVDEMMVITARRGYESLNK